MSLGFQVESGKHVSACYDLLASEARIAVFAAIAKEDIPQDVWFLLGRSHSREHGLPILLSYCSMPVCGYANLSQHAAGQFAYRSGSPATYLWC